MSVNFDTSSITKNLHSFEQGNLSQTSAPKIASLFHNAIEELKKNPNDHSLKKELKTLATRFIDVAHNRMNPTPDVKEMKNTKEAESFRLSPTCRKVLSYVYNLFAGMLHGKLYYHHTAVDVANETAKELLLSLTDDPQTKDCLENGIKKNVSQLNHTFYEGVSTSFYFQHSGCLPAEFDLQLNKKNNTIPNTNIYTVNIYLKRDDSRAPQKNAQNNLLIGTQEMTLTVSESTETNSYNQKLQQVEISPFKVASE